MITERQDGDADIGYLTGISLPFKWVIFPADGKVTALSTNQVRGAGRGAGQRARHQVIVNDGTWSKSIIDSIRGKAWRKGASASPTWRTRRGGWKAKFLTRLTTGF